MVGEVKKGRYVYYHCTGYRGKCAERYTREEVLQQKFAAGLRELLAPSWVLKWMRTELVETDQTERAARAQALRRQQTELEGTQARLDLLYDDRLDGRIDAATYDKRAAETRKRQEQLRQQMGETEATKLAPLSEAVDLIGRTSEAAGLFQQRPGREQSKLLHLVLEEALWKGGELRMSLREPFEELRLSNRGTPLDFNSLQEIRPDLDNWR
jgi:site-specific DNA recombinase